MLIKLYFHGQILRAALSVCNNIAEGYERLSLKEKRQFLIYARGSCGEVRNMIHIAKDCSYYESRVAQDLIEEYRHLSIMISKFIKTIK